MIRRMFHTQEKRGVRITEPIKCVDENAWLGEAWYFWYYRGDADFWGITFKRATGYYEVYSADINCENVLDTVFNEEHYNFWIDKIEKAIKTFYKKNTGQNIKIRDINDFFMERGLYEGVDCVMFQDITRNPQYWVAKNFQYKKRIQLAIYNRAIIANFVLESEEKCV
jgi:hypothetical protein